MVMATGGNFNTFNSVTTKITYTTKLANKIHKRTNATPSITKSSSHKVSLSKCSEHIGLGRYILKR